MTWYWWKHWFWITGLLSLTLFLSLVETYPLTPIYSKEYNKDKTSRPFPLVGTSDDNDDDDDIFNGNHGILLPSPGLILQDNDNSISYNKTKDIDNNERRNHSLHNLVGNSASSNTKNANESTTLASLDEENKNDTTNASNFSNFTSMRNNKIKKEITKGDELKLGINSTLNNLPISNSSDISNYNNTLSTNSSIEVISNSSQPINIDADDESECNTSTTINSIPKEGKNRTSECGNSSRNDEESLKDSLESYANNNTKASHKNLTDYASNSEDIKSEIIVTDNHTNNNNNNNKTDNENIGQHHNNSLVLGNIMKVANTRKHENQTKDGEFTRTETQKQLENGERSRKSKVLSEYRNELKYINFSSDTKNLLARSAAVSLEFDEQDDGNVSSEALSIRKAYILDAGAISGICFAVLGLCFAITLAGITLYRRRYLNKPQTLSEPDSSGYIDDSTIRDNSDEMYSLDNDSFLNSLEAMTIQNYWTDTVKHTKL